MRAVDRTRRPAARRRARRAVAALALLGGIAGCGDDPPRAADAHALQRATPFALYWLGTSFAGLPLTSIARDNGFVTVVYGDCDPQGDAGCAPPLQIQTASICDRNVLRGVGRAPSGERVRGVYLRDDGEGQLMLSTATATVVVFAGERLGRDAVAALRPVTAAAARPRLPAERYPRAVVDELRRVRDAVARGGGVRAARDRLGISQSAIRHRLALARELGGARLRRPAADFVDSAGCAVEPAR